MESVKNILHDLQHTSVSQIVNWNKPVVSGIYAAALLSYWFVFVVFEYTFTTMAARLVTLSLVLGAALTFTKTVTISPTEVSAHVDRLYDRVRPHFLHTVELAINIVTWKDMVLTLKVVALSFAVAFVGNFVSDAALALVVLVVTFTVPLVYKAKKNEIDDLLAQVKQVTDKYLSVVAAKGKAAVEKADEVNKKAQ